MADPVGVPSRWNEQGRVHDGVPIEDPTHVAERVPGEAATDLRKRHVDDEQVEAGEERRAAQDEENRHPESHPVLTLHCHSQNCSDLTLVNTSQMR